MKASVVEIQVGGGKIVHTLREACQEYVRMLAAGESAGELVRTKIHFTIMLPSNECKSVTVRDDDEETLAYGDFEGLPSFLDYAKGVKD